MCISHRISVFWAVPLWSSEQLERTCGVHGRYGSALQDSGWHACCCGEAFARLPLHLILEAAGELVVCGCGWLPAFGPCLREVCVAQAH